MSAAAPATKARIDRLAAAVMVLLCCIWAVQQVASKVAISQGIPPLFQALARSCASGALVAGWLLLRRGRAGIAALFARDGTLAAGSLAAGLFAVEFICLFEGMKRTSASHAVVLLYSAAFFTALGTHLLVPGERMRRVNALGLGVAFAGVAVTIGVPAGGSLIGDLLMLAAAAGWGGTTVVIKRSRALMAALPEKVLLYQLVGAIPILLPAALFAGELPIPQASPLAWWCLGYQVVIVAFASYLTWFWLIGRYPAGRLAAFSFLTPLLGVLAAAALLGDPLAPTLLVGLVCVGVGLRLVNR